MISSMSGVSESPVSSTLWPIMSLSASSKLGESVAYYHRTYVLGCTNHVPAHTRNRYPRLCDADPRGVAQIFLGGALHPRWPAADDLTCLLERYLPWQHI